MLIGDGQASRINPTISSALSSDFFISVSIFFSFRVYPPGLYMWAKTPLSIVIVKEPAASCSSSLVGSLTIIPLQSNVVRFKRDNFGIVCNLTCQKQKMLKKPVRGRNLNQFACWNRN